MTLKSVFTIIILTIALASFTSCSKSSKKHDIDGPVASAQDMDDMDLELNADSDSGKAGNLQTVYFNYNSSRLTDSAKAVLKDNAEFLMKVPLLDIQIEGHCDERGGVQYNLALGERRANSVRKFLANQGVKRGRISTVTFGKERPVSFGHDEDAWSRNRRGNFVITAIGK